MEKMANTSHAQVGAQGNELLRDKKQRNDLIKAVRKNSSLGLKD